MRTLHIFAVQASPPDKLTKIYEFAPTVSECSGATSQCSTTICCTCVMLLLPHWVWHPSRKNEWASVNALELFLVSEISRSHCWLNAASFVRLAAANNLAEQTYDATPEVEVVLICCCLSFSWKLLRTIPHLRFECHLLLECHYYGRFRNTIWHIEAGNGNKWLLPLENWLKWWKEWGRKVSFSVVRCPNSKWTKRQQTNKERSLDKNLWTCATDRQNWNQCRPT